MGVTPATIIYLKHSKLGRAYLDNLERDRNKVTAHLQQRVADIGDLAVDVVEQTLIDDNVNSTTKLRAALSVLEYNGLNKGDDQGSKHLSDAVVEAIKQNAKSSGIQIVTEDADFSET